MQLVLMLEQLGVKGLNLIKLVVQCNSKLNKKEIES